MLFFAISAKVWPQSAEPKAPPQPADTESDSGTKKSQDGFFKRLGKFYSDDWSGAAEVETESPRRIHEQSYDLPAYDSGTKSNQFTFAVDVIFKF